jgi:P-type Cu+ transporter
MCRPSLRRLNYAARFPRPGFEALELGGEAEDAEALAREHEINEQRRLLIIGLIFTVPLFVLSMAKTSVCCLIFYD